MSINTLDIGIQYCGKTPDSIFENQIRQVGLADDRYTLTNIKENSLIENEFDVVFAILQDDFSTDKFIEEIAGLKLVNHIHSVIAVVPEARVPELHSSHAVFHADLILITPVTQKQIQSELHTILAVHDIGNRRSQRFKNRKPLGTILVESEVINSGQLSAALEYAEAESVKTGQALIELGFIKEDQMVRFLAAQLDVKVAGTSEFAQIDRVAANQITESFASHNLCIPFKEDDEGLHVILSDPKDIQLLDRLRDLTDSRIVPYIAVKSDIVTSIQHIYHRISTDAETTELFEKSSMDFKNGDSSSETNHEEESDEGIVKLVKLILTNASRERASDVHIEPRESELVIRYRIDGELRRMMTPPLNSSRPLLVRLKIMAKLDIAERRRPQDGRFVIKLENGTQIDARLSVLPTVFGEKAVIRLLDSNTYARRLQNLGFTGPELELLNRQIHKPNGLIVITGPTGSGKTTTLYAALQDLCDDTRNIVSVEDPVEYTIPEVSQIQVNSGIGLTFASALRSILRQDPDVVMIGEIRDAETADIAVKMALTGHLVFATLHTNSAPAAITRFIDIGIPPLLLSSCLNMVIAQRLVKKLCPNCREESANDPLLKYLPESHHSDHHFKASGCVSCHSTGYNGRIGLYEMMEVTPAIRDMILRNAPEFEIKAQAIEDGMKTLYQCGLNQAAAGATSLDQIISLAEDYQKKE